MTLRKRTSASMQMHTHVSQACTALELVVPLYLDFTKGVGKGRVDLQQLGQAVEE